MLVSEVEGLQDAVRLVLKELLSERATRVQPRGLPTREVIGATVKIQDPRRRLMIRPASRRWSLAFAMAEYLWYMRGANRVDAVGFYAPGIHRFSDDGETLHSAYGYRIFGGHADVGFDQWQRVKEALRADSESRQAFIHIRTPADSLAVTKDHPCTIGLQFFARTGELHLVVTMRSNDIILGTPYDIFSFTMMQEQMALELGLELGAYVHQVGSWHLYESERGLAEEMVDRAWRPRPMPHLETGLEQMIMDEEHIRQGLPVHPGIGYWRDWRLVLGGFVAGQDVTPRLRTPYQEAWGLGRQSRGAGQTGAASGT